jgi:hypothetical protein
MKKRKGIKRRKTVQIFFASIGEEKQDEGFFRWWHPWGGGAAP